jgi:phage FluMu protein Com
MGKRGCNTMPLDNNTSKGYSVTSLPRPPVEGENKGTSVIPPEHQAVLSRRLAPNGLAYREINCVRCGYHLVDDGILIGCVRKKCPKCKFPNEIEINRVGEQEELEQFYANAPQVK